MVRNIGPAGGIPVLLKVAKLVNSLTTASAGVDTGDITLDKRTDEVALIYAADLAIQNGNGLGTGTEVEVMISRRPDADAMVPSDADTMIWWHFFKSFVTSGMQIEHLNFLKTFPHPLVTSRPTLRVVAEVATTTWTGGLTNVYVYYTTRELDAEARRILIGVE